MTDEQITTAEERDALIEALCSVRTREATPYGHLPLYSKEDTEVQDLAGAILAAGWRPDRPVGPSVEDEQAWRSAIAAQVRANCTPSQEAYFSGGDALIYAVADWVENPPAWSHFDRPGGVSTEQIEVRENEDGTLDEIVARAAWFHLEQMDDNEWWMGIETPGQSIDVTLHTKRAPIAATINERVGYTPPSASSPTVTPEQVEAAAKHLRNIHFDGHGCGTKGTNACSNCFGEGSQMSAAEVVAEVIAALGVTVTDEKEE